MSDLFDALHDEYGPVDPVETRFDRIDDLIDAPLNDKHVIAATLVCAQLLRRVTSDPRESAPWQVLTLGTVIDQALASLLYRAVPESRARRKLREIHNGISSTCSKLGMMADPGADRFDRSF